MLRPLHIHDEACYPDDESVYFNKVLHPANTIVRVRTSPASAGPADLQARAIRTRKAIRRTSQSTNHRHSQQRASGARRRSKPVPTPPPNSPPSTRPHGASYATYGCRECTTICCSKRSSWRIRSGYGRRRRTTLKRLLLRRMRRRWIAMPMSVVGWMICAGHRWALVIWRSLLMTTMRLSLPPLDQSTMSPSCHSSTRTSSSPAPLSSCTTRAYPWWEC